MVSNPKFQKYLDIAFALHEKNSECRCQHTTVAVVKNRVIAIGRNSRKTSSFNLRNPKIGILDGKDITGTTGTCSESHCLKKICNLTNIPFEKISLYIMRINNNKKVAYSYPCYSCRSLISWAKPKEVFFTDNNGQFEEYIY